MKSYSSLQKRLCRQLHKKDVLNIVSSGNMTNRTIEFKQYINRLSIQQIRGKQLFDQGTDLSYKISIFQFNPEIFYRNAINKGYKLYNNDAFYYFNEQQFKEQSDGSISLTKYHKVLDHDLTQNNILIEKNITITFDSLDYSVNVSALKNTFYHVQLLGVYSDDPQGQIFTNMDIKINNNPVSSTLIQQLQNQNIFNQQYQPLNYMLSIYINSLLKPYDSINSWTHIYTEDQIIDTWNIQRVIYHPQKLPQNKFSKCINLREIKFLNNLSNIIKYIPSNALPQDQDLVIHINSELQRVIMQDKYPRALIIIDEQLTLQEQQISTQSPQNNTILLRNRKQKYQLLYNSIAVTPDINDKQIGYLTGNVIEDIEWGQESCVVVKDQYIKLGGQWTNSAVKHLMINSNIVEIQQSISLPQIQQLTLHNINYLNNDIDEQYQTFNIKDNNFQNCTLLRQIKFQCKLSQSQIQPQNVFKNCHEHLQVYCQYYSDIQYVYQMMLDSGYINPVVKYLNPQWFDLQYTSFYDEDFTGGLFIGENQQAQAGLTFQNCKYSDVIINNPQFIITTDMFLNVPLKTMFINSNTTVDDKPGDQWLQNCFNNTTLTDIYFINSHCYGRSYYPYQHSFTALQRSQIKIHFVRLYCIQYCQNINVLSNNEQYCAVQWPCNLKNVNDYQRSILYSQFQHNYKWGSEVQYNTAWQYGGSKIMITYETTVALNTASAVNYPLFKYFQSLNIVNGINKIYTLTAGNTGTRMGIQQFRLPEIIKNVYGPVQNYWQLGTIYVDGLCNISPASFQDYDVNNFNVVLIPLNQTIYNDLIAKGFHSKNIMFNEILDESQYQQKDNIILQIHDDENYNPHMIQQYILNGVMKFNYQLIQNNFNINRTYILNNSQKIIKYSEYPVMFILEIFINGLHVETVISKDEYFEKLNNKQWIWSCLERSCKQFKISVIEKYFDGSMIHVKDDQEDHQLFMRLWIR